jgi:hypothetical protein
LSKQTTNRPPRYSLFFPEEAGFVPYQQRGDKCAFDLDLTRVVDKLEEAWDAAITTDMQQDGDQNGSGRSDIIVSLQ